MSEKVDKKDSTGYHPRVPGDSIPEPPNDDTGDRLINNFTKIPQTTMVTKLNKFKNATNWHREE